LRNDGLFENGVELTRSICLIDRLTPLVIIRTRINAHSLRIHIRRVGKNLKDLRFRINGARGEIRSVGGGKISVGMMWQYGCAE